MATFAIREMEFDDLPRVFALGESVFTAEDWPNLHRTWDEYELLGFFANEGDFCLVAEREDGGEIVGFVIGTLIEKRRSAWTYGWLGWLAVQPGLRRQGLARRLVERLTELFVAAGARMMLVDTEAGNGGALRFFDELGFAQPREHVYLSKNLTGRRRSRSRRIETAETTVRRRGDRSARPRRRLVHPDDGD